MSVSVDADDFIFEALLTMTRHNKRRLAIKANGAFVGILEDIDILGLVAGNSQLIPGRIDRAHGVDELAAAATDIQNQVERLERQGLKVEVIAEITSDLNRRLFARLFELIAPPSMREAGCLMVMGSEGRGEQTVRTDQDNGAPACLPGPTRASCSAFARTSPTRSSASAFPPAPAT